MAIHTHGLSAETMLETAKSIEKELVKRYTLLASLRADNDEGCNDDEMKSVEKAASSMRIQANEWRDRAAKRQSGAADDPSE